MLSKLLVLNQAKKYWKEILIGVLILLFIPIVISSSLVVTKSVPAIKPEEIRKYINVSNAIAEEKCKVDWRDLIAIDAVRFKQDFSRVTEGSIRDLAERFIITKEKIVTDEEGNEKTEITYECKPLSQVLDEMGFTEEQKKEIELFRSIGLYTLIGGGSNGGSGGATVSQQEFFERISEGAISGYLEYGVFPSLTIAQAIIESGWGGSGLTQQANNLFGIKAYNWSGPSVTMMTTEYYGGVAVQVPAAFRAYSSWEESILDHSKFLYENSRYAEHGVFSSSDGMAQVFAVASAGYATDPNYAMILIGIIDDYGLTKYDDMAREASNKAGRKK